MKSWNRRIVYNEDLDKYAVTEVYYDKSGHPEQWTIFPVVVRADSAEELHDLLVSLSVAAKLPLLVIRDDKFTKDSI